MNILAFSDFHGSLEAVRKASQIIKIDRPDLVMIAGDLGQGSLEAAKHFLGLLSEPLKPVFFVPGNIDDPALSSWSGSDLIIGLHGKATTFRDLSFLGLGGAPSSRFGTLFEYDETRAAEILRTVLRQKACQRWVLLSHAPPKMSKVDRTWAGEHAGSIAVRKIIEEETPILAVCGHIHEARGIDEIRQIPVVNIGPAIHDSYAAITINQQIRIEQLYMRNK